MNTPPYVTSSTLDVLHFVREYIADHGWAPTIREICSGMGYASTSTVHWHLHNLAEQRYIEHLPGSPRAIRILERPQDDLKSARQARTFERHCPPRHYSPELESHA